MSKTKFTDSGFVARLRVLSACFDRRRNLPVQILPIVKI